MKKEFGKIPNKDNFEEIPLKSHKNENFEKKKSPEKSEISQKEPNIAFRIIKKH